MSVEIVYYNTAPKGQLESALSSLDKVNTALGEDRRSFLVALSKAVSVSNTVVAVGGIGALTTVLSKGLGLPLTPVDWAALGIAGQGEVMLPKGALPLLLDGTVGGMIIENAAQCIIVVDDGTAHFEQLTETYVVPYLQAVIKSADEPAPVAEPEPQQVDEPVQEEILPVDQPQEELSAEAEPDEQDYEPVYEEEESDLFSDIEDEDFLDVEGKKKKGGLIVALICILAVLVIGIVGGYFAYTKWWLPKQYDDSVQSAKAAYSQTTADDVASAGMPENYSVKFATLYKQNPDVIGWLKVEGLGIDTPVVTAVRHSAGYYKSHLFGGENNPYGTPYIEYAYDTGANINPNLVIYGNNTADGKAFSKLESLLTADGLGKVKSLTTDSALFGEEKWSIISVMLAKADGGDYNFADNFKELDSDARTDAIKNAVEASKVDTGLTVEDISRVELTDAFITLVTPYSQDDSKVVVVVASRIDQPTNEAE